MRALVYTAPGKVEIEDQPRPSRQSGETEIAVEIAGICGSDISGFLGHSALRRPPLVLGHELVGRLPDGRRVVAKPLISCSRCDACLSGAQNLCASWKLLGLGSTPGSFAEYVLLPESQFLPNMPSSLNRWRTSCICFGSSLLRHSHTWRLWVPGLWGRWHSASPCDRCARHTGSGY